MGKANKVDASSAASQTTQATTTPEKAGKMATGQKVNKWSMGRVAKYYAAGLAIATVLTAAGLLIAKFALKQNIDFGSKTFVIASATSLGGAILLPLLIGGGIKVHQHRKTKKELADMDTEARVAGANFAVESLRTPNGKLPKPKDERIVGERMVDGLTSLLD